MGHKFNMRGLGKRHDHIDYTAELILSIYTAVVKFPRWSERMVYIREKNPDQAHKLKEKNIKEKAKREGWVRAAMNAKKQAYEECLEIAATLTKDQTLDTLEKEQALVDKLSEQIEKITDEMDTHPASSKEYANLMKSLDSCQKMLGKLSGTDRVRKSRENSDKATVSLALHRKKLEQQQEMLGMNPFQPERQAEVTIIEDEV